MNLRKNLLPVDAQPACAKPEHLSLVDLTFDGKGPAASNARRSMARDICPTCPVALQCLELAMERREFGTWGGTTQRERTEHGGEPDPNTAYHAKWRARAS